MSPSFPVGRIPGIQQLHCGRESMCISSDEALNREGLKENLGRGIVGSIRIRFYRNHDVAYMHIGQKFRQLSQRWTRRNGILRECGGCWHHYSSHQSAHITSTIRSGQFQSSGKNHQGLQSIWNQEKQLNAGLEKTFTSSSRHLSIWGTNLG